MKDTTKARWWIVVFLVVLLAPMVLLFVAPRPPGREFLREFAVGLGFAGMSLLGLQFLIPARLPFLLKAFRLPKLNHFHHNLSLISLALIVAHMLLLLVNNPRLLRSLSSVSAARPTWLGIVALAAMGVVVWTSLWQGEVNLGYQPWRVIHTFLSVIAIVLAMLHIFDVGYYMSVLAHRILWIILAMTWAVGVVVYFRRANMSRAVNTVMGDLATMMANGGQEDAADEAQDGAPNAS